MQVDRAARRVEASARDQLIRHARAISGLRPAQPPFVYFVYFVVKPRRRICRAARVYGKKGIWYNVTRKDNSHGYEMQALRFGELWARLRIRPESASRTSRRREALRMVRLVKLRTWVRIWPRQDSPAWSGKQQVHLVRLDCQRLGLSILPYAPP
jgi:hypothetical protein